VSRPLALVGVEEKGFLNLELTVRQKPGHASRPPAVQATAILGAALARLGKKRFPWALTDTVVAFFKSLAAEMPPLRAFVLANARALGPLFFKVAATTPETAALLRTTVAMTQLSGSPTDNVLPSEVTAVLNLRLHAGWTIERAAAWVRRAVADDRVEVAVSSARAANDPITATAEVARGRGVGWAEIAASIGASFPDAAILPYLVTATTDSRHYARLCDAVYRFVPLKLASADLELIHGHDERISIDNFIAGIDFYRSLIAVL
jgi:carboxypeptidase PM20D1